MGLDHAGPLKGPDVVVSELLPGIGVSPCMWLARACGGVVWTVCSSCLLPQQRGTVRTSASQVLCLVVCLDGFVAGLWLSFSRGVW